MSKEEIATMVSAITDVLTVLSEADPADKAELYAQLGLRLTYNHRCKSSNRPSGTRAIMYERVVSEGGSTPYPHIAV